MPSRVYREFLTDKFTESLFFHFTKSWSGALQFVHTKRLESTVGGGIFELRGIRFPRTAPKGDIIPKFNSCLVAVLNLAKRYEKGSLARETLRSVAKSLPALILPLRSHGSQTHISTNVISRRTLGIVVERYLEILGKCHCHTFKTSRRQAEKERGGGETLGNERI